MENSFFFILQASYLNWSTQYILPPDNSLSRSSYRALSLSIILRFVFPSLSCILLRAASIKSSNLLISSIINPLNFYAFLLLTESSVRLVQYQLDNVSFSFINKIHFFSNLHPWPNQAYFLHVFLHPRICCNGWERSTSALYSNSTATVRLHKSTSD